MTDLLLPDVSEFQTGPSTPDWAGIKKQNGGAGIIRVGYGHDHLDHMFVANYTALKATKFSFTGLYHYIVAGQDITAQARAFCAWIGPPAAVAPGTVFMCDLEEGAGNQHDRAMAWLGFVDKFYGLDARPLPERSWLYSGASFAVSAGLAPIFASPRRTWVAAYSAAEPKLGHTLWQSTNGKTGRTSPRGPGAVSATRRCTTGRWPGWPPRAGRPRPRTRRAASTSPPGSSALGGRRRQARRAARRCCSITAVHSKTFGEPLARLPPPYVAVTRAEPPRAGRDLLHDRPVSWDPRLQHAQPPRRLLLGTRSAAGRFFVCPRARVTVLDAFSLGSGHAPPHPPGKPGEPEPVPVAITHRRMSPRYA